MSQKSFSVKSHQLNQVRGLNSETSFRQSQAYDRNIKNNGYDQTIYKPNASEQGEMARSLTKLK